MWMLLWGKLECLSIFVFAADFNNTQNVACVVCLFQNNNKFHFKNVMSINICITLSASINLDILNRSFLSMVFAEKDDSSWMKKQSCQRKTRGQTCHLMKRMEMSWIALLMASWSATHTAHRNWTVQHHGCCMWFYCIYKVFELKKAEGIVLFTLWPPLCSLCQTQRCTVFTWSQWGALQSRASSKCPTEIITTWTYFLRYTVYFILSFSLLK